MINEFYYVNHKGETFTFGTNGVFVDYGTLFDYKWDYNAESGIITKLMKKEVEKEVPAMFFGDKGHCRKTRNEAYVIFDKDVLAKTKGRFYVGDYYLNCWIIGASNADYHYTQRYMETTFTIVTDDPTWRKESLISLVPVDTEDDYGVDFAFDFPFDFGPSFSTRSITLNHDFESDFVMTFYGPVSAPFIQIAGHTYGMTCNLEDGERVVIDSVSKTIKKYDIAGYETNAFNYRYKEESIFEKIQPGINNLSWSGKFGVDITVINSRSEPPWWYTEEEEEREDLSEHLSEYLLDSDDGKILDSDSNPITVDGKAVS